jgi:hypothetical protein
MAVRGLSFAMKKNLMNSGGYSVNFPANHFFSKKRPKGIKEGAFCDG